MRVTKKDFGKMIKEAVMQRLNEFQGEKITTGDAVSRSKLKARDSGRHSGLTPEEKGLIDGIETMLNQAGKVTNLTTGDVGTRIGKLIDVLQKLLAKAGGGEAEPEPESAGTPGL